MKKLTKKEWIAITISVFVVGFFFIFGQNFMTYFQNYTSQKNALSTTQASNNLGIQDTRIGSGDVATIGNRVTINYVGHFSDGTIFDSSTAHTEPAQFVLGSGRVIEGLDKGIIGMSIGGKRILTIPPTMGYGANQYGPIPANSTLTFEVELLKVEKQNK